MNGSECRHATPYGHTCLPCNDPMQRLADLGDWVLEKCEDGGYPDYEDIIDKALSLGILEQYQAQEPCGADECACGDVGFPTTCYRRTDGK